MKYNKEIKLMRKSVSLTQRQNDFLIEESTLCQTSESDILRRILDEKINDKMLQIQALQKQKSQESGTDD